MFRTQTNAFDEVVVKATDENLTSENWEFMMDAWERVNSGGENGPKDAVAALIKRLAHRNANVQLYTLELANAFTQNCGPNMHRELASRAFTDALLRLAGDRNTHAAVKSRVLEKMAEWTEMFKNDPGLGIMEQAYDRVKSANPNLQPPSKPTKREITDVDRQKEEEELQMALAISLKEKSSAAQAYKPAQTSSSGNQVPVQAATPPAAAPHTTAATVSRVRALYDFVPSESGELAFRKGDIIAVLESVYKDWWKGSLRGQTGIFPLNYVEKLSDPTAEELHKDAQMEAEVFGQIKNVEKLLALLSTSEGNSSVQDNEEITTLYHSTLQIRPKLIELIGKYSQKKDDFVALNEKFIKARRDYEALLESSMSQTAAAHYGRPPAATNPYTYPPSDGFPEPSRYYTPGPQQSASPQNVQGAYPPPQQKPAYGGGRQSSNQYYPQQSNDEHHQPGPTSGAPFYVVGQMPPSAQHGKAPSASPAQPHHQQHQPPSNAPPASAVGAGVGNHQTDGPSQPQELATSIYDTPIEPKHESSFAGQPASPSHPPSSPYYQPYQHRPLSTHQPSYPADGPSPISPQNPYPQLQGSPSQTYQAYPPQQQHRPQNYYTPQHSQHEPPNTSSAPTPMPQDYYRQSELFLPNGSRAQG